MRLRLNDQAVLCVEIMLDIASWVTQQIFAISMPAICHNRRTTTFYNFSTTFEAKRMAQEDTRRMKKISRIEYCAGFEPLQSGMEQRPRQTPCSSCTTSFSHSSRMVNALLPFLPQLMQPPGASCKKQWKPHGRLWYTVVRAFHEKQRKF